jgi:hypothetical protein
MKWAVESKTLNTEGEKFAGSLADHRAWIRGDDEDEAIFMCIFVQAKGITPQRCEKLLEAMAKGLNEHAG